MLIRIRSFFFFYFQDFSTFFRKQIYLVLFNIFKIHPRQILCKRLDCVFNVYTAFLLRLRRLYGSRLVLLQVFEAPLNFSRTHFSFVCQRIGCFRLFMVTTGCPSERRHQKTISCYGG